jgi:phytoene synthase
MTNHSEKSLREAYDFCIKITRRSARNFYYGIRLLRRERFASLCALYAFCRELDDAVDCANPQEAPRLFSLRRQLICDGTAQESDKIAWAFADTIVKYQLPKPVLDELVDTIESDTSSRRFQTKEEVQSYAHGVASTVGLCSVRIFGIQDGGADGFAELLGIALQWTNILRDIEEDHRRGRCYLPQSELRKFGLHVEDILSSDPKENARLWWQDATQRGRELFRAAGKAFSSNHRQQLRPAIAMAAVYRMILERMARYPAQRPCLSSTWKLAGVLAALLRLWNPFH